MAVLEALQDACPTHGARAAEPGDAFDGLVPSFVARPATTGELSAALAVAGEERLAVAARGGGTKLDWGLPPRALDLVVDCSGLDGVVEHARGDLVLRALAGTRLAAVQEAVAEHGQWLPVDEVVPGSTLGGVVATGLSGPSRQANGAVRDLLIGVTAVRVDGVVARSGGKVVKNVAGYDLPKLFTGSYGTLALCSELTFRLRPRPAARRFLTHEVAPADLAGALRALRRAPEAPSALELVRDGDGPLELTVLLEGRPGPLEARAAALSAALGAPARAADRPPARWGTLPGTCTLKVTSRLGTVPQLVSLLERAAASEGLEVELAGSPGVGVFHVGLPGTAPAGAVAGLLAALRRQAPGDGWTVVLRAPAALRAAVDCFGPVPGLELMRRVKAQFDPEGRLAPGRFVVDA